MNEEFGKPNKGYRDSLDVRLAAEKVAGGSFEDFFQRYVASAERLPYQHILGLAGLELKTVERRRPSLGFSLGRDTAGALVVRSVDPDSHAAQVGLRSGDAIFTWNRGEPPRDLEEWLNAQKKGNTLHLGIRREEQGLSLDIKIGESLESSYVIIENAGAGEKARRIREGLLRGTTQPVTALVQ
jgi:predicted metalloprotease with PDZ domain